VTDSTRKDQKRNKRTSRRERIIHDIVEGIYSHWYWNISQFLFSIIYQYVNLYFILYLTVNCKHIHFLLTCCSKLDSLNPCVCELPFIIIWTAFLIYSEILQHFQHDYYFFLYTRVFVCKIQTLIRSCIEEYIEIVS